MAFSNLEKQREAVREVIQRERIYDKFVRERRLNPEEAKRRIEIMREIAKDYFELAKKDSAKPDDAA